MKTKKWELIKHAYENYPKGTKYKPTLGIEAVSSSVFHVKTNEHSGITWVADTETSMVVFSSKNGWSEIITEEPQKIGVKVENEKDFKALMRFYDEKGWKWLSGANPLEVNKYSHPRQCNFNTTISFCDKFRFNLVEEDYKIIPFADFAKEHNIKLPLLTSEDGVDLYEGDIYTLAYNQNKPTWILGQTNCVIDKNCMPIKEPNNWKAFYSRQSALDWIEKENEKLKCEIKTGDIVKVWDNNENNFVIGKLTEIINNVTFPYRTLASGFVNAKKLTKEEVIQLLFDDEKTT